MSENILHERIKKPSPKRYYMYRKFDEETIERLLETGIEEFAEHGLDRANINIIAKRAGVSVGVIYKYYEDKDHFFLSCVEHSLKLLEITLQDVMENGTDLISCIRLLAEALLDGARKHPSYYVMYNEITSGSCKKFAKELAQGIEKNTAKIYAELIKKAQEEGVVTTNGNPKMFAFFFDNLLMSLQFSFACDYYKERMKIFCGEDVMENPDKLVEEYVSFITSALGVA